MNPLISNAVYDNYFIGQLWQGGLLTLADQPNDPTFSNYSIYTNMADWYNVSTDQLDYFFNLKSGLKWQDDTPINASDVAFTYLAAMNPDLNSPAGPTLNRQLSNTTSIIVHNSTLIEFKLTQWDPLTLTNLFTLTILPQHVYSAGNLADVTKWSTDATDTGSGGAGSIIGSGPYEFVSYSNGVGKLKAWSGYDAAYASKFSEVPYNSAPTLTNITIVKINDADVALTALKNGEADYGDTNIGFNSIFSQVLAASNLVNVNATGAVWQELGLNQASPIWGLSPQDPSVLYYVAPTASSSVESSSTAGTPFGDITTIVGAMTFVAIVAVFYRKRKNRLE
jgi:ABC-type transport system substrate-binding protein